MRGAIVGYDSSPVLVFFFCLDDDFGAIVTLSGLDNTCIGTFGYK